MRRPGRWRRATVIWVAGTSFALAAPAPGPADEDAIATARRDYEAIKAAGAGTEAQKLTLPRQEMPQLDLKPADEPVALPAMTARKEEAERLKKERGLRSSTWLLDAMKEPAGDGAAHGGVGEQGRRPALAGSGAKAGDFLVNAADLTQESERNRREDKAAVAAQKPTTDVVNPLSAFMASWMTPRDVALLKSASVSATEPGQAEAPPLPAAGSLSATITATPEIFPPRYLTSPEAGTLSASDGSKNNPYLSELASFAPVATLPPTSLPAPTEPALRMSAAPASPESPPTAIPAQPGADWSKARDDEKYFKQLKRF